MSLLWFQAILNLETEKQWSQYGQNAIITNKSDDINKYIWALHFKSQNYCAAVNYDIASYCCFIL